MPRKPDTISYREFNKLTDHTDILHDPLPSEVLFDDENIDELEEILMGMEYDAEDFEEVDDDSDHEIALDLSEDEYEEMMEDETADIEADFADEIDESAYYK